MNSVPSTAWLSRFVEDVRVLAPVAGLALQLERLPDGRTTLVFREHELGRKGDLSISGPRTRALFKSAGGVVRAIVLQFKPGWTTPLLGLPTSELTDQIVPLERLWGRLGSELVFELLAARSLAEVLDRLSKAFSLRAPHTFEPASARLARRAARLFEGGATQVDNVAEQLGVTARHLRRAFTESIGIGPKDFVRTVRLRRAVRMAATTRDWGQVALDAGYYDQSHLIGDFRDLVGVTPGAFLKRPVEAGRELTVKNGRGPLIEAPVP